MKYDYILVGIEESGDDGNKEYRAVKELMTTEDVFVQVYDSFLNKIPELTKCAIAFALFIGHKMTIDNKVTLTITLKNEFIKKLNYVYKLSTVNAAITELKETKIIIPMIYRQEYIVNPTRMFKSKLAERFEVSKTIKKIIISENSKKGVEWDEHNKEK